MTTIDPCVGISSRRPDFVPLFSVSVVGVYPSAGNDGIVFTPSSATYLQLFNTKCALPLLKWKPLEDNTIDFRVKEKELEELSDTRVPTDVNLFIGMPGSRGSR